MNEYCANLLKNKTFINSLQQSIGEKQVEAGTMYRALRSALFESINDASLTLMKKTFDLFIQEGIIKRIYVYNNQCKYTISLPSINSTFEEHSDNLSFLKELYKITWEETDPLCWQSKNQTIQKHFIFSAKDKNEAMYIATNKLAISYKLYKFNLDKMDFIEVDIYID